MGRISMATRDELVVALAARYQLSNRDERGRILDEFTAISGLHRKHAMRLLRAGQANRGRAQTVGKVMVVCAVEKRPVTGDTKYKGINNQGYIAGGARIVVAAIARELLGFAWAIACQVSTTKPA